MTKYVIALIAAILLVFTGLAFVLVLKVGWESWKIGKQMKALRKVKPWTNNRYR